MKQNCKYNVAFSYRKFQRSFEIEKSLKMLMSIMSISLDGNETIL